MTNIERLALHVGLTSLLIQQGTPLGIVKQQMVPLMAAAKDVLNDEETPDGEIVRVATLVPDAVASDLAELSGDACPDDLSGLEG